MFYSLWPHEPQHSRPPCASPTPRVHPNLCALSRRCHPTISSSVIPFSFSLHSFAASGSSQMSQLFASGGQRIGVSASKSVLPVNTQHWSPLGWTGWISLQSKGLSKVFTSTTVQKHQVFGIQPIDPQIVCAIGHSFKTIYWTNIMLGFARMKKAHDSKPSQLWILYLMTVIPDIHIWSKNIFTSIPVL